MNIGIVWIGIGLGILAVVALLGFLWRLQARKAQADDGGINKIYPLW